jgi:hypothetical protein
VHEDDKRLAVVHVLAGWGHRISASSIQGRLDSRAKKLILVRLFQIGIAKLDVVQDILVIEVVGAMRLEDLCDGNRLSSRSKFCEWGQRRA